MNNIELKKNYMKATLTIEIAVPKMSSIEAVEHSIRHLLDSNYQTFLIMEEKREAFK